MLPVLRRCCAASARRRLVVLGIETSCDDTAAAVLVTDHSLTRTRIASQVKSSQFDLHSPYGGVVPFLAARAHKENLPLVVNQALQNASMQLSDINMIAVTTGPGLSGCLWEGLQYAQHLSSTSSTTSTTTSAPIPVFPVNHLEGHVLTARLFANVSAHPSSSTASSSHNDTEAAVAGGHCQLVLAKGVGQYTILGTTLDDSVGEAYDKVARILGLGMGGGVALEKAAAMSTQPKRIPIPIPMLRNSSCNFSFSGLKADVKRRVEKMQPLDEEDVRDVAAAFQICAVEHLRRKTAQALKWCQKQQKIELTALVVCGGVAANSAIRSMLTALALGHGLALVAAPPDACTDNALMIAWASIERLRIGETPITSAIEISQLTCRARWPLGESMRI